MKTLLLMRHAKSDWDADYRRDHDRPLNDRGVRSARLMGRLLASEGLVPDLVISSSAVRAATTAELANGAGGWGCEIVIEPDFYDSGPDTVIGVVAQAPDVGTLMVVGHQPIWGMLARRLSGMTVDVRTATVVVIEFDVDAWSEVDGTVGTLVAVHQPRDHFGSELDR